MELLNKLHNYQLNAVDFALKKKRVALWLDMGLGKTVISLTVAQKLIDKHQGNFKVLIIAPLLVANNVWHEEIQRWEHLKHLTWSIVTGNEKQRLSALYQDANIYITNRDNVSWLYRNKFTKWDLVIIDESASFKSSKTKRFKDLVKFQYQYMIQLTGTPAPSSLIDIWGQIYLLDHGLRLGKNIYQYLNKYFVSNYHGYNWRCLCSDEIHKAIEDVVIVMKSEDYLELPDLISVNTKVELPHNDFKTYKQLERDFIVNINNTIITTVNAAALSNKLFQYCNGAVYDEYKKVVEVHKVKIDALKEIVENNPNDNILVVYNFKSDLQRLQKEFEHAVVMDKEGKKAILWNEKKIKLLLCHPASAGEGLNLQKGGNIIVWFSLTWNLKNYLQMNKRLHRQGQLKPVIINHIVVKDCIDEKIMKSLMVKDVTQTSLLNALRLNFSEGCSK
jgi:SNF2 family DNA or RNA helicase